MREHALFISHPLNLRYFSPRRFTRVYFGNEFCDRLLPTKDQLLQVLNFCHKNALAFAFVTPYCTNLTIKKVEPLLDLLPSKTEVVLNDFGLLESIKYKNLVPVLGRLLVSVSRDPRIPLRRQNYDFYFKANNLHLPFLNFLQSLGIRRVELDNIKQGYDIPPMKKISLSLYYPFVCSSVTRRCIFANLGRTSAFFKVITRCRQECWGKILKVKISGHRESLYVMGNAQYYINLDKSVLREHRFDRLVYMPVFPNNSFHGK